jgi:hypothetical protein
MPFSTGEKFKQDPKSAVCDPVESYGLKISLEYIESTLLEISFQSRNACNCNDAKIDNLNLERCFQLTPDSAK